MRQNEKHDFFHATAIYLISPSYDVHYIVLNYQSFKKNTYFSWSMVLFMLHLITMYFMQACCWTN